ncbi:MAG: DUF4290 domain-containing protein [Prolixibacteraceae bacterium]|jgi:hypothetical protein|nr:DUF4290 domain-containing protein [Bacteroidota bacterium]NLS98864.1 DUF4290 domain-containing protein [Bacteroidales bacterium]OQB80613.1 MAG: hypothetical protein BWX87_01251 [Bacteroidetes bacterium ADurb.Bin123]HNU76964.1 DUF4290 domain-containing protein [Prolixibacteraceae bacterium]HNZ68100.1 DUF4290 domain-containing protein [Prolixibacteraceae bacterium]
MTYDSKDYNTSRKKLALPEYGRNIHNMVDLLKQIEDRERRNRAAHVLVDIMGSLNPYLRDVPDFKHKLWDHLAIMANFKLDIDYPYDPPSPEVLFEKPKRVPYCQRDFKHRHYGYSMELMIKKAMEFEDGKEKDILVYQLANHMKKSYLAWNKDSVEDEKILDDLESISKGQLKYPDLELAEIKSNVPRQQYPAKQKTNRRGNPSKRH